MKSRDQVTFSPTSCRQTNDGSERTLKEQTQLANLLSLLSVLSISNSLCFPFILKIKILHRYSNVITGGKVEHSVAHAVYDTARHLL